MSFCKHAKFAWESKSKDSTCIDSSSFAFLPNLKASAAACTAMSGFMFPLKQTTAMKRCRPASDALSLMPVLSSKSRASCASSRAREWSLLMLWASAKRRSTWHWAGLLSVFLKIAKASFAADSMPSTLSTRQKAPAKAAKAAPSSCDTCHALAMSLACSAASTASRCWPLPCSACASVINAAACASSSPDRLKSLDAMFAFTNALSEYPNLVSN
mmetsp:Transcript_130741/g.279630  ORF Transcript_130741/g.279630 Transcript_130741/m.279630 type:complete len:215 (-) Transcript_130741:1282-1926(-)